MLTDSLYRHVARRSLTCTIDDYDLDAFLREASEFDRNRFGYVVTPNVDHLIRFHDDANFRALYDDASYVLLDSRFLSFLFRLVKGLRVRVCTGSDLTAHLFSRVIQPNDKILLIGGDEQQADFLRKKYKLNSLEHHNPPMGFIRDGRAIEECVAFIEARSPFRFCFIAVGSPQQEMLARIVKNRDKARGMALCIGASINFMTGVEQRAPSWMQGAALEWMYRLMHNPKRLAYRYLVRGLRIFPLLPLTDLIVRMRSPSVTHAKTASIAVSEV